jgi:predicted nucleic acid-binding protein
VIVIADTTPLNYLVLIGEIDILPALYTTITIPDAVYHELHAPNTPQAVTDWLNSSPQWLEVKSVTQPAELSLGTLDAGEREAIQLAEELGDATLLMDDRDGRRAATARGIKTIGTLGILDDAAEKGLLELPAAIDRLKQTSFRFPTELVRILLERDATRRDAKQVTKDKQR